MVPYVFRCSKLCGDVHSKLCKLSERNINFQDEKKGEKTARGALNDNNYYYYSKFVYKEKHIHVH